MSRKLVTAVVLVIVLALLVAGCAPAAVAPAQATSAPAEAPEAEEAKFKVAFLYSSPVGDGGWTDSHNNARIVTEEKLGIVTAYSESVQEGPDAERIVREYAKQGFDAVIGASGGYDKPLLNMSKEFPDMIFVNNGYADQQANLGAYYGRMYEARYLSGILAGMMTESNKLGYVAAFPVPVLIQDINAFALGARSVNPDAVVHLVWTNTWYDPAKEKEAALALLDEGCDIISQHQNTPEPQKAAEERGKYSIGYGTDMAQFAPKAVLTSVVWDWEKYYTPAFKSMMDGTWTSDFWWGGLESGVVTLSDFGPMVPDDVKALVLEKRKAIEDGTLVIFEGPINGQNGELALAEGQKLTDEEIQAMNWLVEGVVGEAPSSPPTPAP